jgi:large subunit ribosomal protein L29
MKAAEIRSKTDEELQATATELREKLFRLRMQLYTGQLEKPGSIKQTRRTIARVETVLTERALVAANAE